MYEQICYLIKSLKRGMQFAFQIAKAASHFPVIKALTFKRRPSAEPTVSQCYQNSIFFMSASYRDMLYSRGNGFLMNGL